MSQGNKKFGTALNCMDGRAIEATIAWMEDEFALDFVDNITEPGMDGLMEKMSEDERAYLKRKLGISINNHGSRVVAVAGHDDCAGNPVTKDEHATCIAHDIDTVKAIVAELTPEPVEVIGLWIFPGETDAHLWGVERVL